MGVFSNNNQPQSEGTQGSTDYEAYNKWLEENIGTDPVSETGIISGIIDLGIQPQDWNEYEANEKTAEEEQNTIAYWEGKGGKCYFKDGENDEGKACRMKFVQKKPTQSFAFSVDFPQYMVPWNEFSENIDEPKPYRVVLNGKFKSELAKVYPLSWENLETDRSKDPVFSVRRNSIPYKLALNTGAIKNGDRMFPQDIPKILGKAAQFQITLKRNGDFLNERVKLQGVIPAALVKAGLVPKLDEKFQYAVEFDEDNNQEHVDFLQKAVKNTMKKASNYEGSKLQQQLEKDGKSESAPVSQESSSKGVANDSDQKAPDTSPAGSQGASQDSGEDGMFDEDIPF
tara:strand:+ start:7626 stop:8651 length:1026 start_codon:yes stop_codon:yes gene_type:complete